MFLEPKNLKELECNQDAEDGPKAQGNSESSRGVRVLIILAVSLALLGIAYFVIHGYYAGTPHQTVSASPRPVLAAAAPLATHYATEPGIIGPR